MNYLPSLRSACLIIGVAGLLTVMSSAEPTRRLILDHEGHYTFSTLSPEQMLNLFETAGFAVGVGEWRPERDGRNGLFHVARQGDAHAP